MPGHPGTSTRAANAAALWDQLRRARVSSVTDLARAAGTSRPTASAVLVLQVGQDGAPGGGLAAEGHDVGLTVSESLRGGRRGGGGGAHRPVLILVLLGGGQGGRGARCGRG